MENGIISWKSPMARAMLGRCEGDDIVVAAPQGKREMVIVEVRYEPQPELPADFVPVKVRLRA